jgi:hypothetical protein
MDIVLALVGIFVVIRTSRRYDVPAHVILCLFPAVLLSATLRVVPAIQQMVNGFVQIAAAGRSDSARVTSMCVTVARLQSTGILGSLAMLVVAGIVQVVADRRSAVSRGGTSFLPQSGGGWTLVCSSVLVVAVAVVIYQTEGIARVVMVLNDTTRGDTKAVTDAILAGRSMGEMGEVVGTQLQRGFFIAIGLTGILLISAIVNMVVVGRRKAPESLAKYSWLIFSIACAAGIWAYVRLEADIRTFTAMAR